MTQDLQIKLGRTPSHIDEVIRYQTRPHMPFKTIPGIVGNIYVPEENANATSKHKCSDCHFCQWCNDDKCRLCLGQGACETEQGNSASCPEVETNGR